MLQILGTTFEDSISAPVSLLESEELDVGLQNIVVSFKNLHTPIRDIECDKKESEMVVDLHEDYRKEEGPDQCHKWDLRQPVCEGGIS